MKILMSSFVALAACVSLGQDPNDNAVRHAVDKVGRITRESVTLRGSSELGGLRVVKVSAGPARWSCYYRGTPPQLASMSRSHRAPAGGYARSEGRWKPDAEVEARGRAIADQLGLPTDWTATFRKIESNGFEPARIVVRMSDGLPPGVDEGAEGSYFEIALDNKDLSPLRVDVRMSAVEPSTTFLAINAVADLAVQRGQLPGRLKMVRPATVMYQACESHPRGLSVGTRYRVYEWNDGDSTYAFDAVNGQFISTDKVKGDGDHSVAEDVPLAVGPNYGYGIFAAIPVALLIAWKVRRRPTNPVS